MNETELPSLETVTTTTLLTSPAESKKYTFWDSLAWHLMSRRSRMALGTVISVLLLQCKFLGLTDAQVDTFTQAIVVVISVLIYSMSGDKKAVEE